MIHNILDYGAVGDGMISDTASLQKAIDACHAEGGGTVLVPGGRVYRSGTIILKSYVNLHLEMGAVIKANDRLEDFNLFINDEGMNVTERTLSRSRFLLMPTVIIAENPHFFSFMQKTVSTFLLPDLVKLTAMKKFFMVKLRRNILMEHFIQGCQCCIWRMLII